MIYKLTNIVIPVKNIYPPNNYVNYINIVTAKHII